MGSNENGEKSKNQIIKDLVGHATVFVGYLRAVGSH